MQGHSGREARRSVGGLLDSPLRWVRYSGVLRHEQPLLQLYLGVDAYCVPKYDRSNASMPRWNVHGYGRQARLPEETRDGLQSLKSVFFPVHYLPYSRVCGRVIAYQEGSADAFWQYYNDNSKTVDDDYVDGVTITVGYPRTHVWSFAASQTEGGEGAETIYSCPCARTDVDTAGIVPPFVGSDYFCESGTEYGWAQNGVLYQDDPLWDGKGCPENSSCCRQNNPPWFCKDLGREFRHDFEVRLCGDEELGNEDIPLELIELYVQ